MTTLESRPEGQAGVDSVQPGREKVSVSAPPLPALEEAGMLVSNARAGSPWGLGQPFTGMLP